MSTGSPKLARREQAIEATRRRLRRLEIETHRIKAELARLEADYEDDVADWLSRKLRRRNASRRPAVRINPTMPPSTLAPNSSYRRDGSRDSIDPTVMPESVTPARKRSRIKVLPIDARRHHCRSASIAADLPREVCWSSETLGQAEPGRLSQSRVAAAVELRSSLRCTFALPHVHDRHDRPAGSPAVRQPGGSRRDVTELSNVKIQPTKFEDAELQNVVSESPGLQHRGQLAA